MRGASEARKLCCVGVDLPLDAGTCGRMVHAESQRCIHCSSHCTKATLVADQARAQRRRGSLITAILEDDTSWRAIHDETLDDLPGINPEPRRPLRYRRSLFALVGLCGLASPDLSSSATSRSHHRVRTRARRDGRLHHPRPDVARQSPAHDFGTGGMVRLPRDPDQRHRPDGPRDAGADRRRLGAEGCWPASAPDAASLRKPYTHLVLSWPEGTDAPTKQDMLSAVGGALKSIRLDDRHYAVCAAQTRHGMPVTSTSPSAASTPRRAGPSTSTRAPRCVSAGGRMQYERDHGGIVVPTRVERRKAQAARRDLERRCRKGGQAARCRPARPPRGCTRGRRRSRPGRDRPHHIWPSVTPRSYASRGSRSAISAGAPNSRDLGRRPEQRHDDTPAGSPFTRRGARGRFGSGSSTTASSREARAAASSGSQPDSMSAAARQWRRRAASARRPSTSIAYWIPR